MIVTRQRPKKREVHKIIMPIVALLLVALVFALPPSRNLIVNGPMAPVWHVSGNVLGNVLKPFHFATLNNEITVRDRQIAQLQSQLNDQKNQTAARDRQISALQSQINQLAQQNANAGAKPPAKSGGAAAAAANASAAENANDLTANATPDMRRTASQWASMDAESAAKVVQRLPVPYAARILALMPADAAGQILNALPASYAAALTQEHPELRP